MIFHIYKLNIVQQMADLNAIFTEFIVEQIDVSLERIRNESLHLSRLRNFIKIDQQR